MPIIARIVISPETVVLALHTLSPATVISQARPFGKRRPSGHR